MVVTHLSYNEALQDVKARVAASRTSFHAGMAVLSEPRRNAMYGLYAFCRVVDDIADDSPSPDIAAQGLAEWRQRIHNVFQGQASCAITTILLPAISAFGLVEKEFQEIINGMEMDATAIVAPNMKTLDTYCDLVASAVGRVSVRIFGDSSATAMRVAHHLGRALQLTNILRDLYEDATRGRLYLPQKMLEQHEVTFQTPRDVISSPHLPDVCRDLLHIARAHYIQADCAIDQCNPTAMRPARIMRAYYAALLDRLEQLDWQDPTHRVRLSGWQKMILMIKGFLA